MKHASVLVMALLLLSCATPYQRKGFAGGFSETQLSENIFTVYFRGNGYTRDERADDFTLLRSAEVAEQHGFAYFIVTDEQSAASFATVTTPTQSTTTASVTVVGNTAYATAHTTTWGGQSFLIRKPSRKNTIACFATKPDIQGMVYASKFVVRSLREKYGMSAAP